MAQKEVWIDEMDLDILLEALRQYQKRIRANADQTKRGYDNCKSWEKRTELLERAERCNQLESEISQRFI